MQTHSGRPDRTLLVILSIIAAMAILALVVVFTRGAPTPLDPSTPEGVVQTYSNAVIAGDRDAALTHLTSDLKDNCEAIEPGMTPGLRLTLISTRVNGDHATVRVAVSSTQGGSTFGGSSYETDDVFILERVSGGNWKINTSPWELTLCYMREGN